MAWIGASLLFPVALGQDVQTAEQAVSRLAYVGDAAGVRSLIGHLDPERRSSLASLALERFLYGGPVTGQTDTFVPAMLELGAQPQREVPENYASNAVLQAVSKANARALEIFALAGVPLRECRTYRGSVGSLAALLCGSDDHGEKWFYYEPWTISLTETTSKDRSRAAARVEGKRSTVEVLLRAGADPMAADLETGAIAFHRACYWGEAGMVRAMLAHGADPAFRRAPYGSGPDKGYVFYDWDALHVTALRNSPGNAEVATVLLEAGADPDARDSSGETALDLARRKGHVLVAKALRGASP